LPRAPLPAGARPARAPPAAKRAPLETAPEAAAKAARVKTHAPRSSRFEIGAASTMPILYPRERFLRPRSRHCWPIAQNSHAASLALGPDANYGDRIGRLLVHLSART